MADRYRTGWDAALAAAAAWHQAQASQALIQARRSRFPKSLERDAAVHARAAEMLVQLDPEDV